MLLVNVVELKVECDSLGQGRPNSPQVRAAVTHNLEPLKGARARQKPGLELSLVSPSRKLEPERYPQQTQANAGQSLGSAQLRVCNENETDEGSSE